MSHAVKDILERAHKGEMIEATEIIDAMFPGAKVTREPGQVIYDLSGAA